MPTGVFYVVENVPTQGTMMSITSFRDRVEEPMSFPTCAPAAPWPTAATSLVSRCQHALTALTALTAHGADGAVWLER